MCIRDRYTDIGSKRHKKNKGKGKRNSAHADIGKRRNHVNKSKSRRNGEKRVYLPPNPAISNDEEKLVNEHHVVNPTESSPATNEPALQEVSPHQQASTYQPDIQEVALHQSDPNHHEASRKQEAKKKGKLVKDPYSCLLYTSPSPRDQRGSRMPSSA